MATKKSHEEREEFIAKSGLDLTTNATQKEINYETEKLKTATGACYLSLRSSIRWLKNDLYIEALEYQVERFQASVISFGPNDIIDMFVKCGLNWPTDEKIQNVADKLSEHDPNLGVSWFELEEACKDEINA